MTEVFAAIRRRKPPAGLHQMRLHLPYLTVYRAFPGKAITIACNSFVPQGVKELRQTCPAVVYSYFFSMSEIFVENKLL